MKIVIADKVDEYLKNRLIEAGMEVIDISDSKDRLFKELVDAKGLVVRSATQVDEKLLSEAKLLKVIGRPGVGLDNVDIKACKKRGITVFNSPEAPSRSVAEFTIGLMLDLARNISFAHHKMKGNQWAKKSSMGIELYGKKIGIIGTGAIGSIVAKFSLSLGMEVLGYDVVENESLKLINGFRYVSLDELYEGADVITIHVPLLPQTKHIMNSSAFAKMKKGVLIINASRGGVIKEDDLLEALEDGTVLRAALDVYENEPLSDERIKNNEKILLTPHIGASTKEAQFKNGKIIADKLINFLQG